MNLPNLNDAKKRTKKTIETIYLANEENNNLYQGKKYFLRTYGCQMNVHDSENISGIMEDLGYTKEENYEKLLTKKSSDEVKFSNEQIKKGITFNVKFPKLMLLLFQL